MRRPFTLSAPTLIMQAGPTTRCLRWRSDCLAGARLALPGLLYNAAVISVSLSFPISATAALVAFLFPVPSPSAL